MKTIKVTNGVNTVETNDFLKGIWLRDGYVEVEETDEDEALTYQELKSMAKEAGINTHGMKKEEIIAALGL